jgi:hypothetical protein
MQATLDILTGGQYEVRCYGEPDEYGPVLARRRIVSDLHLAESMIVAWEDGSPALWDIVHGERGTFTEWRRVVGARAFGSPQ